METQNNPQIRLCTGTCGRMTRPTKWPSEKWPNTMSRASGGMCSSCLNGSRGKRNKPRPLGPRETGVVRCAGTCGRMTRPYKAAPDDFPGIDTVRRYLSGFCKQCTNAAGKPEAPTPAEPLEKPMAHAGNDWFDIDRVAPDADPHLVKMADAYTRERRARLARNNNIRTSHGVNLSRRGIFA